MRLDDADQHIATLGMQLAAAVEHRVGLADAGRCTEINAELATRGPTLLLFHLCQQDIGVGALMVGWRHGK